MKSLKMIFVVLGIFILKFQASVSQFPSHMDLQKVGEVIFNNEKYNILKPTVHVVTDYFKDFMNRRENKNSPTKRVFIDHNGFRHSWTGFGKKTQSLRKTDLNHMNGNVENTTKVVEDSTKLTTVAAENSNEDSKDNNEQEGNETSEDNETVEENNGGDSGTEIKKTTTTLNIFRAVLGNDSSIVGIKHKMRQSKNVKPKPANSIKISARNPTDPKTGEPDKKIDQKIENRSDKGKKERTVAKTTFFCPFFGVITMSAFID